MEEPHGQASRSASHAQLKNYYHGDAPELNFVKTVDFAIPSRSATGAGADGLLVSRIMSTSFALEIEVCGGCAVGYGDLRPLAAGARRCGSSDCTAGPTTDRCLKEL